MSGQGGQAPSITAEEVEHIVSLSEKVSGVKPEANVEGVLRDVIKKQINNIVKNDNISENIANSIIGFVKERNKNREKLFEKIAEGVCGSAPTNTTGGGLQPPSNFIEVITELKKLSSRSLDDIKNSCQNRLNDLRRVLKSPPIDTCYDKARAERLERALDALRKLDDECKLPRLLFAVYREMIRDGSGDRVRRLEWIPSLLRAVAEKAESRENVYLPLCPWEGDLAAVGYYILVKCGSGGGP